MVSVYRAGRRPLRPTVAAPVLSLSLAIVTLAVTACAHSMSSGSMSPSPANGSSASAPNPDPRVGLKGGLWDAGQAEWNVRLVSNTRPSAQFLGKTNSDLAFIGNYV